MISQRGLRVRICTWWIAGLLCGAGIAPLQASAPEVSLRPVDRPAFSAVASGEGALQSSVAALVELEQEHGSRQSGLRPTQRPVSAQILAATALPKDLLPSALDQSLVPFVRPDTIAEQALFKRRRLRRGAVCGDVEIQGKVIGGVVLFNGDQTPFFFNQFKLGNKPASIKGSATAQVAPSNPNIKLRAPLILVFPS